MAECEEETTETGTKDKRRFQRFEIGVPVLVRHVPDEGVHVLARSGVKFIQRTAIAKDISLTGMYLLSGVRYALSDRLEIQLTLGARTHKIHAVVVRCVVQKLPGRESYGSGVQFIKCADIATVVPAIAAYLRSRFKTCGASNSDTPKNAL